MVGNCKNTILAKTVKIMIFPQENIIFKKSKIEKKKNIEQKSMKNRMFFGTSILKGFWKGFGRVLGSQNPRFSHIFRCFFDVIFQARFGRRKNREKMRKKQTFPLFGLGFAVVPPLLGKGKDRGKNTSDRIARTNYLKECRDWPAVIVQSQLEMNLARCWHTFGGRRIESPRGGDTAGHPTP